MDTKKYIVKGRIRELVEWGKRGQLRRGSYQFLPNTEVLLTSNNVAHNPKLDNRFWVRGRNKSGLFTTKGIYFKYLFDLYIEEVVEPNSKTLVFIEKNGVLFFNEERKVEIEDWLRHFEEAISFERLSGAVDDDLFIKAQQFVSRLQTLIRDNKKDELIANYLPFPIAIRHYPSLKKNEIIHKEEFDKSIRRYFIKEVCQSILETDIDTIFPTEKKLLAGNVEISITKDYDFRISKIIYSKKHR